MSTKHSHEGPDLTIWHLVPHLAKIIKANASTLKVFVFLCGLRQYVAPSAQKALDQWGGLMWKVRPFHLDALPHGYDCPAMVPELGCLQSDVL